MLPKVVVHNSMSLDGSLTNFNPNMELHYQIAASFNPEAHLIGSNTIRAGIELYEDKVPTEEEKDFEKPKREKCLPYWVIPDTRGILEGLLHTCRRFEFCKDVIVMISETTPAEYIKHLEARNYAYHVVGRESVDIEEVLELLSSEYKVKRVLADTGRILGNLLIEKGFASELSVLVHPIIVGKKSYNIFSDINKNISLKLRKQKTFPQGYLWLVYTVKKDPVS
jgi:2,5-diamino-6-(ribosylamino)-4(3H)-pyrimidinone 5'-phosphate reductase